MRVEVITEVLATPARVWEVLEDVESWPEWTESMAEVRATSREPLGVGSTVRVKQPGFPAAVWTITVWAPGHEFTWENRSPGVRSTAVHQVEATGEGTSTVRLSFEQRGALAPVLGLFTGARARRYVHMELAGLKARSEPTP
jgi:uncharacterized protein YndB with AHSA1/START domain